MKQALKNLLHNLKLREKSKICHKSILGKNQLKELEEEENDDYRRIDDTEVMGKYYSYLNKRKEEQRQDQVYTYYKIDKNKIEASLNKYNDDKSCFIFEIINMETFQTFQAKITFKEQGIFNLSINNSNVNVNNFPESKNLVYSSIKLGNDSFEIFLNNKLSLEDNFIQKNILGETSIFDEVSLKVNFDPFYIDYYIYPSDLSTYVSDLKEGNYKMMTFKLVTIENLTSVETYHYNSSECWGLPERMCSLILKDNTYKLFNVDRGGHQPECTDNLYGSFPLIYHKHRDQDLVEGFLVDNPSEAIVDIKTEELNKRVNWKFSTGNVNVFFFSDEHRKIFFKNTVNTGFPYLPPLFALGYHHCRWGYDNIDDAMTTEIGFDDHDIPLDVFWFDIDHTNNKHYFTWDPNNFPIEKVKAFLKLLSNKKRQLVTIIDPHLSIDDSYSVSQTLKKEDCLVKNNDENKTLFVGDCWPGKCYYGDYFNPKTLKIYKEKLFKQENEYFLDSDNMFTWVDMNEPSVFDLKDKTFNYDTQHFDGEKHIAHRQVHNIYGQMYHKTACESLKERYQGKRPFVLTRSTYPGSQQYGFHWTGDNTAWWPHIKYSLHMLMSLGYCGMVNCGADVGGFSGTPTEELLSFWYEVGTFYPFFRAHSDIAVPRREPWKYSENTLNRIRNAVVLRYNLILYFYTQSYISSQTGKPHLSPYLTSDHLYSYGDEFVILVKSESDKNDDASILTDSNQLYDFRTGLQVTDVNVLNQKTEDSNNALSIFIKGGSIIPWVEKALISAEYTMKSPYSLMLFPDKNGNAKGYLYLDDGNSYNYNNKDYLLIYYTLENFHKLKVNVINKPTVSKSEKYNSNQVPYYHNFWENIFLFGHPKGNTIKRSELLIEGYTLPLNSSFKYVEEANLVLTTEIMINITDSFTVNFN